MRALACGVAVREFMSSRGVDMAAVAALEAVELSITEDGLSQWEAWVAAEIARATGRHCSLWPA